MKNYLLCFLLLGFLPLGAQLQTVRKVEDSYFPTGKLKTRTITYTTTRRKPDLYNQYKKEKLIIDTYDSTGTKVQHAVMVKQYTLEGRPCRELRVRIIDYDSRGHRIRFEKSRCDGKRSVIKEYQNKRRVKKCVERRPRKT